MKDTNPKINPERLKAMQDDIAALCEEMLDDKAGYSVVEFNDAFILIAKQAMHVMYLLGMANEFVEDNAGIKAENTTQRQENLVRQILFIMKRILDKEVELGYYYGPDIK